jgi:predicted MPP superfamily phosphohydrolase
MSSDSLEQQLASRVGAIHLRQRLGIQRDHVTQIFGRGRNFFHIENWYSVHALMRLAMRVTGFYGLGRRNAAEILVTRNLVRLPRLPDSFLGFTLLHLSDLHLDMSDAIVAGLMACLPDLQYDACVITGDFRARTYGDYQEAIDIMGRVRSALSGPVYGVLGNHDFIEMVPGLEGLGIRMLLNESVVLRRGDDLIVVAGIDDPHYYRVENLEKAAEGIDPDIPSILLSHSPEIYRHAAHAGFDLMLCGHTHGGQICLPGGVPITINAKCPRHLGRGAWRYQGLRGYTSVGAGSCVVDARFNCPPEITLHRLMRGPDTQ